MVPLINCINRNTDFWIIWIELNRLNFRRTQTRGRPKSRLTLLLFIQENCIDSLHLQNLTIIYSKIDTLCCILCFLNTDQSPLPLLKSLWNPLLHSGSNLPFSLEFTISTYREKKRKQCEMHCFWESTINKIELHHTFLFVTLIKKHLLTHVTIVTFPRISYWILQNVPTYISKYMLVAKGNSLENVKIILFTCQKPC